MKKIIMIIALIGVLPSSAQSLALKCNNNFDRNMCDAVGTVSSVCPPNRMKLQFALEVDTGQYFSSETHRKETNSKLNVGETESIYVSFNNNEKQYLPDKGLVAVLVFNGERIDRLFQEVPFHNYLSHSENEYISTMLLQSNDTEINGTFEYYPNIHPEPSMILNVRIKDDPPDVYLYKINGFCTVVGSDPFASGFTGNDALKLFK